MRLYMLSVVVLMSAVSCSSVEVKKTKVSVIQPEQIVLALLEKGVDYFEDMSSEYGFLWSTSIPPRLEIALRSLKGKSGKAKEAEIVTFQAGVVEPTIDKIVTVSAAGKISVDNSEINLTLPLQPLTNELAAHGYAWCPSPRSIKLILKYESGAENMLYAMRGWKETNKPLPVGIWQYEGLGVLMDTIFNSSLPMIAFLKLHKDRIFCIVIRRSKRYWLKKFLAAWLDGWALFVPDVSKNYSPGLIAKGASLVFDIDNDWLKVVNCNLQDIEDTIAIMLQKNED